MISREGDSERTGTGQSQVKEPGWGLAAAAEGRTARSLPALASELEGSVHKLTQLLTSHVPWSAL